MIDPEPSEPPRPGREFLVGFFSFLMFEVVCLLITAAVNGEGIPAVALLVLVIGLDRAAVNRRQGRRHLAFGILAAVVAAPLLLVGTCAAIISTSFA